MPPAEPARAKRVIIKKEIVDRVLLSACSARLMRLGPSAHARFVCALLLAPKRLAPNDASIRRLGQGVFGSHFRRAGGEGGGRLRSAVPQSALAKAESALS